MKRFDVEPGEREVLIRIEDERGAVTTLLVTREQLDLMADLIDDALLSGDSGGDDG